MERSFTCSCIGHRFGLACVFAFARLRALAGTSGLTGGFAFAIL
jgi:hypothetical protein